jgi:hypothetical protein
MRHPGFFKPASIAKEPSDIQIVDTRESGEPLFIRDVAVRQHLISRTLLRRDDYVYLVPFVEDELTVFLKTIIPSRKATKQYLGEESDDEA